MYADDIGKFGVICLCVGVSSRRYWEGLYAVCVQDRCSRSKKQMTLKSYCANYVKERSADDIRGFVCRLCVGRRADNIGQFVYKENADDTGQFV